VDFGIAGKSALIVGGSKGIGFEVAKMLAADGCRVAVLARTQRDIDAAVDTIRAAGGTAIAVCADISRQEDVENAIRQVRAESGPPLVELGQAKFTGQQIRIDAGALIKFPEGPTKLETR
jgi:3-oxoacyl-[acyl-carrier protein] reductase